MHPATIGLDAAKHVFQIHVVDAVGQVIVRVGMEACVTAQHLGRELRGRRCLPSIVLESKWDGVQEPNASVLSSGVTILDDYTHGHYAPVATFGTVAVLQALGARP